MKRETNLHLNVKHFAISATRRHVVFWCDNVVKIIFALAENVAFFFF